jgi:hypothetical protein
MKTKITRNPSPARYHLQPYPPFVRKPRVVAIEIFDDHMVATIPQNSMGVDLRGMTKMIQSIAKLAGYELKLKDKRSRKGKKIFVQPKFTQRRAAPFMVTGPATRFRRGKKNPFPTGMLHPVFMAGVPKKHQRQIFTP